MVCCVCVHCCWCVCTQAHMHRERWAQGSTPLEGDILEPSPAELTAAGRFLSSRIPVMTCLLKASSLGFSVARLSCQMHPVSQGRRRGDCPPGQKELSRAWRTHPAPGSTDRGAGASRATGITGPWSAFPSASLPDTSPLPCTSHQVRCPKHRSHGVAGLCRTLTGGWLLWG